MLLIDFLYKDRILVKETEWDRVYSVGPNQFLHVSKFLSDNLSVSAKDIIRRWSTWSPSERLDFANAFDAKDPLTADDDHILEYLIEHWDEVVGQAPALMLPRTKIERDKVLAFLLDRVKQEPGMSANYYQALAELGDQRAVPGLKTALAQDAARIDMNTPIEAFEDIFPYCDYLQCCVALYSLTGAEEYAAAVYRLSAHSDEKVRAKVRLIIPQLRKPERTEGDA